MKVPLNWLKEYVAIKDTPAELAAKLTSRGVKVDYAAPLGQELARIKAGRITALEPHPGADRLQVATVEADRLYTVVTGAPNVAVGQLVPLAVPGAVVAGGQTVEVTDFRGVRSEGMVLAADEMGLPGTHEDGLLILPDTIAPGTDLVELFSLHDHVLELDLTPNFSHCLSMVGVARELAAINQAAMTPPVIPEALSGGETARLIRIRISAPDLCRRYTARIVREVKVGPSPIWLQRRLQSAGMRPINNVVDVTNYVMLELGQPLHAFDYDLLHGSEIIVRRAGEGESITTLDGVERELTAEMLVIADRDRAVALAGVMGGQETEVTEATRTLLLESANFVGWSVRRTGRAVGIRSEASARFEKEADPEVTAKAVNRVVQLLEEIGAGRGVEGLVDVYPAPVAPRKITLRFARVNQLLGVQVSPAEADSILNRLGCRVSPDGQDRRQVEVPTWRTDIEGEIDLIEEIARHYGYDRIPSTLPTGVLTAGGLPDRRRASRLAKTTLAGLGLAEVVTYTYLDPELPEMIYGSQGSIPPIVIANPLSEERSAMRTTLVPQMVSTLAYNWRQRNLDLALFELGPVYRAEELPLTQLPEEPYHLSIGLLGRLDREGWDVKPEPADFYTLKGIIEALAVSLGVGGLSFQPSDHAWLHPGRQAVIYLNGDEIGVMGELHPDVVDRFELGGRPQVAELCFDRLTAGGGATPVYRAIPRFPAAVRDLALVVRTDIPAEVVLELIRETAGPTLAEVRLFDVYEGRPVTVGFRSLAYTLVYRADRTLNDDEIDASIEAVVDEARSRLGAQLRV
ncbi:MAG: phenylalanine--tRNA ligase subunit beta [Bacillota bacterium]